MSLYSFHTSSRLQIDPKTTSPIKSPLPSDMPIRRYSVMFVLENALYLIMSQAVRYLREPAMSSREKQLLKRELSAELVSCYRSVSSVVSLVAYNHNVILSGT